jgi:hypothetical protein
VWGVPTEQARSNIIAATTIELLCDINTPPIRSEAKRRIPLWGQWGEAPLGLGGEKTRFRDDIERAIASPSYKYSIQPRISSGLSTS